MKTWDDIQFFKPFEFDSPDELGSGANMDLDFVSKLDAIRDEVGVALPVHSGYRSAAHNASVGGVDSSAHENGLAADLGALSSGLRFAIVQAAVKQGIRRIGIGNSFVHLDADPSKPQDVIWLYPAGDKRT